MDKPSLVPELFFDLLARFIPGGFLIAGLCLAIPGSLNVAIDILHESTRIPPDYVGYAVSLTLAYVVGCLLQFVSESVIMEHRWMQKRRWMQFGDARKDIINECGNLFEPEISRMLDRRIMQIFRLPTGNLTYYLCFDYVRTRTANGPTIVKFFAESSCLCSLTVAMAIIGIVLLCTTQWLWAILMLVTAGISYKLMKLRRKRALERLFLSLLMDDAHRQKQANCRRRC